MPTTGHDECNAQDRATFDTQEVQSIIAERRRDNIDRSRLGIPAEDFQLSPNAHFQMPPAFYFPQSSQSSSSWDRVSATSYTRSFSNLDPHEDEHGSYGSEGQFSNPSATPLTLNIPTIQSHGGPYKFVEMDPSFANLSPWQSGQSMSPDSLGFSANTLSTGTNNAARAGNGSLECPGIVDNAQDYLGPHAYTSFDHTHDRQGLGAPSQAVYSSGEVDSSILRGLETLHPISPSVENSPMDTVERACMNVSAQFSQASVALEAGRNRQGKKKSTSCQSRRKNLDKINALRSKGACMKCKLMREQCDCSSPCQKCENSNATVWRELPCIRLKLKDAEIHRKAALTFPKGLPKFEWCENPRSSKSVTLYNIGFTNYIEHQTVRPALRVTCRKFRSENEDHLKKSWISSGQRVNLHLPAYAMSTQRKNKVKQDLEKLVENHSHKLLMELKVGQGDIISMIIDEACRQKGQCGAVNGALEIAVITRLMSRSFNISAMNDGETLGIGVVNDPDSPYYGRIPVPPLLDAQIDELWMEMIERRRKHVLSQLTNMIFPRDRREKWYKVFLTTLILMLNLEVIYRNQREQQRRYGITNNTQEKMIASWEQGAENLLWHFRVICHGEVPLQIDWNRMTSQVPGVDQQAQQFLTKLQHVLLEHSIYLRPRSRFFTNEPD